MSAQDTRFLNAIFAMQKIRFSIGKLNFPRFEKHRRPKNIPSLSSTHPLKIKVPQSVFAKKEAEKQLNAIGFM